MQPPVEKVDPVALLDLDVLQTFGPRQPKFQDKYEYQGVIAHLRHKERTIILRFANKASSAPVAVRCIPATLKTKETEIETLYKVENMRRKLKLQTIVATHEFVITNRDPFPNPSPIQFYYYIVMDYVPLTYKDLEYVEESLLKSIMIYLLHTLWRARKAFKFYHGDLHAGNIMFISLDKNDPRRRLDFVTENGAHFRADTFYLPVIIDFEKSFFDEPDRSEKFSDVHHIVAAIKTIMAHYDIDEEPEFTALYKHVITRDFDASDNRYTYKAIEELMTSFDYFKSEMVEDSPELKRGKVCVNCGITTTRVCAKCELSFCSQECSEKRFVSENTCH
jgi:thiamine kinase-like enzyme